MRICESNADACFPCTSPTKIRRGCFCFEAVNGRTRQILGPNARTITTGRRNKRPLPSCSKPTLAPRRHHQISRTVYRRDSSMCVSFFTVFHLSKSLFTLCYFIIIISKFYASSRKQERKLLFFEKVFWSYHKILSPISPLSPIPLSPIFTTLPFSKRASPWLSKNSLYHSSCPLFSSSIFRNLSRSGKVLS